ncbi:MAG: Ig-like domain-containing protein [Gemmatimonadota bacterium]|nr:Ig-like domain-containing protein [Gemmatimonadota bacterium]
MGSDVSAVKLTLALLTLAPGQSTQATVVATSSDGQPVSAPIELVSENSSVATVSSTAVVTAIAAGVAVIQATVGGRTGTASLSVMPDTSTSTVIGVADLASNNFDAGTWGQYVHFEPTDEDIVADPTGFGHGKVARFHYAGTNQDRNRFLEYNHALKWGSPMFFRGEFYLDVADLQNGFWGRKLIYYQPHEDYAKYGGASTPSFYSIIGLQGSKLWVNTGYVPQSGLQVDTQQVIFAQLLPRTWYTLESELVPETSIGAGNGEMRVWLDGTLIYEATQLKWSDPAWIGNPLPGGNGLPLAPGDVYFERVDVGSQVNLDAGSFDEYRYWDNVAFSRKRIGH